MSLLLMLTGSLLFGHLVMLSHVSVSQQESMILYGNLTSLSQDADRIAAPPIEADPDAEMVDVGNMSIGADAAEEQTIEEDILKNDSSSSIDAAA